MPHIVVAGKLHEAGLALLDQAAGVSYDYVPDADPSAYLKVLPRAEGLVLRTQPLRDVDIAAAPHLQIVSRHAWAMTPSIRQLWPGARYHWPLSGMSIHALWPNTR